VSNLLEAARSYAARGWRVIPLHRVGGSMKVCSCNRGANCTSAGKHPKDNAWQKAPRLSAADIEATWDVEKPPNLGIATGADSGIWVLDIDPKGGGLESMKNLVEAHGSLPPTFVVQTGSGGYHYFFTLPDFVIRNDQSGHVAPGIDIRGEGGQVVAAPSETDKGSYRVITDLDPSPAPQWLLDLAYKPERPVAEVLTAEDLPKPENIDEASWKRYSAYAQRAIDSELKRLDELHPDMWVQNGSKPWNGTTFEVSCTLVEFANSPWCAYSLGQAERDVLARAPRDNDGFDTWVVKKTFHSALERVGDKARPMPADRQPPTTQATAPGEMPALFSGPDVRGANPTQAGGAETAPTGGGRVYFGGRQGTSPMVAEMASGVLDLGPVGYGADSDFWEYEGGRWRPNEHVVTDRLVHLLGDDYRKAHVGSVEDVVRNRAYRLTGDPVPEFMNFRNGMLQWRTGQLFEHSPEYRSTVQLGCDWDPDATCPTFEEFLSDVMHDDYVALAWEMIGYLMYSGNPLQVAFLFYGGGGNGKGTLMRVIKELLGEENVASESLDDLNENRFSAINLYGRIANLAGDIDATYQVSTANFKKLTGEDTYPGERKFGHRFNFVPWAVPVFSANSFPGSADVTRGYLRRWIVLHFHKTIPEDRVVNGFSELLTRELPGIAAKALPALLALMERGHFDPAGEATKGKEMFAQEIDQVRQWLLRGGVTGGPNVQTDLGRLYGSYVLWTERAGRKKVSESEFSHRLEGIGYPIVEVAGSVYHQGISVPEIAPVTANNFFGG